MYIYIYIHTQISHVFLCSLIHFDWVHRGFNLGLALPFVYEWSWILLTVPCNPMQWRVKIIWVWIKIGHPKISCLSPKEGPAVVVPCLGCEPKAKWWWLQNGLPKPKGLATRYSTNTFDPDFDSHAGEAWVRVQSVGTFRFFCVLDCFPFCFL